MNVGTASAAWTVVVFLVDAVVTVLDLSLMSAGRCSGWRVQGTAAGAPQCKAPHPSPKGSTLLHTLALAKTRPGYLPNILVSPLFMLGVDIQLFLWRTHPQPFQKEY